MVAFRFAWLSVVRQPARAVLGVIGVAAIGALLFDMLLLSRGLVLSFGELLERSGFDVRVLASDAPPFTGPLIADAAAVVEAIAALPAVEAVMPLRVLEVGVRPRFSDRGDRSQPQSQGGADPAGSENRDPTPIRADFIGADPRVRSTWTIVAGQDLPETAAATPSLVVNRTLARRLGVSVGSDVALEGRCTNGAQLPAIAFTVIGIAEFPFDSMTDRTVAGTLTDAARLCEDAPPDRAELLLVRSAPEAGATAAAAAIRSRLPALHVVTNEQLVERFSRVEFSYFRQISTVLSTVTLFFGFLLIAVLLTVSVNQRLGEIAALRAVGLSRSRVTAGVLWESVILVVGGGILAVPLGAALSLWLDTILRALPGIPTSLHFFVYEPRALGVYALLLACAAVGAAVYPMRIVATLPIAETLRREVVS